MIVEAQSIPIYLRTGMSCFVVSRNVSLPRIQLSRMVEKFSWPAVSRTCKLSVQQREYGLCSSTRRARGDTHMHEYDFIVDRPLRCVGVLYCRVVEGDEVALDVLDG